MTTRKLLIIIGAVVLGIVGLYLIDSMIISVDANEIVVTQDPMDGELHIFSEAGMKNQNMGKVGARYPKAYNYRFDIPEDEIGTLNYDAAWTNPEVAKYGIKVRFNDNGEAYIFGSLPTYFPTDSKQVLILHSNFGSFDNVKASLIERQLNSAVFNVGPLMSSKESSSESRSDLLRYIEDIVKNGAYQMTVKETPEWDPITRDTIIVKYAKTVSDVNSPGGYRRQSKSELSEYGIRVGAPVISQIVYSPKVQSQIDTQQELAMNIQTAKAKALEAQQNEKTALSQKAASIAQVEAKFEAEKRQAVIVAEKDRDVAEVNMGRAEFNKREMILKAEGEAEYKRKIMDADGALNQKLDAYVKTQQYWAQAWGANGAAIVPSITNGGSGASGGSQLDQFLQIMSAKGATDLGLNLNVKK